jgi:CHAD domain-containing protein
MSFRLRRKESVEEGVRRIAREEIDGALSKIAEAELPPARIVHEVRKHTKKLRGLLRLVRPVMEDSFARENAWFRDAAQELSPARDAEVRLSAFEALLAHFQPELDPAALAPVRAALERDRNEASAPAGKLGEKLERFAQTMREARRRADSWSLDDRGFAAVAAGLEQTYRQGRQAMKTAYADPTPENFHEWRKRAKHHGYHMRLVGGLWKQEMQVRRFAAEFLSDLLGDDHDLVLLQTALADENLDLDPDADTIQALLVLIDHRRTELQTTAYPLGQRLFAEKPSRLTSRLEHYWQAWRKNRKPPSDRRQSTIVFDSWES